MFGSVISNRNEDVCVIIYEQTLRGLSAGILHKKGLKARISRNSNTMQRETEGRHPAGSSVPRFAINKAAQPS